MERVRPLGVVAPGACGWVAQRNPLTSVSTINDIVVVDWDDGIEGKSEAQYTQELENAFELGLLRTGIPLTPGFGPEWCGAESGHEIPEGS